jgi:hypothetical protein
MLMDTPEIVNLIGLAFNTASPFPLAYDVIKRPGSEFQLHVAETKLQNSKNLRDMEIQSNHRLPAPPYTHADIEKFDREAEERYSNDEKVLQPQIDFYKKHEDRALNWAIIGLLLLLIGFSLQLWAEWHKAPH